MANVDELLPSAADCNKKMALAEAEKASEQMRKQAAVDAEKKALLDKLKGPSGVADDERLLGHAGTIAREVSDLQSTPGGLLWRHVQASS